MQRIALAIFACAAFLFNVFGFDPATAEENRFTEETAQKLLLSEDFFDSFYGANLVELIDFNVEKNTLKLPFKDKPELDRSYLDLPFKMDCSKFSNYELVADVDDPSAIGYVTLYFHSGNGWHSMTGETTRGGNGRVEILFSSRGARTEGEPGGLEKVDFVRFSFWHGGEANATVTFRAFRATRCAFAALDGYEGSDLSYINSTANLFSRCGLPCERLNVNDATPDVLGSYKAVILAIGGKLSNETIDSLCQYVDDGGFLILCYNAPEKLLRKIGVKVKGFVSCKQEKIELAGMKIPSEILSAAERSGAVLPEFLPQNSWNLFDVALDEEFQSSRVSPLIGGNKARALAMWQTMDGRATNYPAIVLSGNGMYCSHVLMSEGFDAKKTLLTSLGFEISPESSRNVVRQDWLSLFSIGAEPYADTTSVRAETLKRLKTELAAKEKTIVDVATLLAADDKRPNLLELRRLGAILLDIKSKLVYEFCAAQPSRSGEGRLWWEHSGCGIWRGDWDRSMKALADAGFNGVIPNMLWGGAAYYDSKVLPVAPVVEQYGDQIAQAVAAGKKYGIEVHAWMVCFNASNSPKWFLDKMSEEGRLQRDSAGEEKPWLCPSNPLNRALQKAALEEVAFNYDVDGVHFDYIRFPDDDSCFCDGCRERFAAAYKEATGKDIQGDFVQFVRKDPDASKAWKQWRCDQITELVREVNESLRARRPDIQISAAVFPSYPGVKDSIGQDWGLWVDKGWLDFVCPMDYTSDPGGFKGYVERQLPYVKGKVPIYPGIGMTATGISMKPEEVVLQAKIAREAGAQGFTIFNLTESTATGAFPAFKAGVGAEKTRRARSVR